MAARRIGAVRAPVPGRSRVVGGAGRGAVVVVVVVVALVALVPPGAAARADLVVPRDQQAIFAQAIFADLATETVANDRGTNPDYRVTYVGSTRGLAWHGGFGGSMAGVSVTGSLLGTISAPSPADPDFNLDAGSTINIGGSPYTLGGSLSFDETLGTATLAFTLTSPLNVAYGWTNSGLLTYTDNQNGSFTLAGSVTRTRAGVLPATFNLSFTIDHGNPFKDPPVPPSITSTLANPNAPAGAKPTLNRGRPVLSVPASFDGSLDLEVVSVPEPAPLALLGAGAPIVLGLGWWSRRRSGKEGGGDGRAGPAGR